MHTLPSLLTSIEQQSRQLIGQGQVASYIPGTCQSKC